MIKYVCFLRGINVGGSKVIKMEDLRKIFESLNLKDVQTFIQSGNILFGSPQKDIKKLISKIGTRLYEALGYEVEVTVREMDALKAIIRGNPFPGIIPDKSNKIYVTFLNETPSAGKSEVLQSFSYDAETVIVRGSEVYLSVDKKKTGNKPVFTNNFIEKKLGLKGTTRDLNTLIKIGNLQ